MKHHTSCLVRITFGTLDAFTADHPDAIARLCCQQQPDTVSSDTILPATPTVLTGSPSMLYFAWSDTVLMVCGMSRRWTRIVLQVSCCMFLRSHMLSHATIIGAASGWTDGGPWSWKSSYITVPKWLVGSMPALRNYMAATGCAEGADKAHATSSDFQCSSSTQ